MADNTEGGGTNGLYFLVGGLVVVVGIIAFVFFGGEMPGSSDKTSITIEAPAAPATTQ
jgi:hypothetical protein